MRQMTLTSVKKGDFFKRSENAKRVYVRGAYVGAGKFSVHDFDDVNREMFLKGSTLVWVDFEF